MEYEMNHPARSMPYGLFQMEEAAMPKTWKMLSSMLIVLLVSLTPRAGALEIDGTGNLGSFRGTLQVRSGENDHQAVLILELTNTASPGNDAVITGWYLNNPGMKISSVTMADSAFALVGGPVFRNGIDVSPVGYYDIGLSIPGGLASGQTRNFQLILQGTDLKDLDASSFAEERPEGGECFLAVRFAGPVADETETVTASPVMEPQTVVTPAGGSSIPRGYALQPNYPNPFNASTNIGFQLPSGGHVSLTIYDVLGRTVRRLVDRRQEAGNYIACWNGRNDQGQVMKSGVYFCVFESGSCRETIKMVLSR